MTFLAPLTPALTGDPMPRVLITGDRNWKCPAVAREVVRRLLARYGDSVVIVHGGAPGVDRSFAEAAELAKVPTEEHPAWWDTHGDKAGPIRNAEMVASGADLCLAFHRDLWRSRGTRDCARRALAAGVPVWLVSGDDVEPVRVRRA